MPALLIIDNNEADRPRYEKAASKAGLQLLWFDNWESAEAQLHASRDQLTAAIVLWSIEGPPSGPQIIAHLHRRWPDLPILAAINTLNLALAEQAKGLGARDLVLIPIDIESLPEKLQRLTQPEQEDQSLIAELQKRLIGKSQALQNTLRGIAHIIPQDTCRVLIVGESGTGKEVVARAIHELGKRAKEEWVAVNISAIPKNLLESHLFGHEKGAFSGAVQQHVGFCKQAGAGTLVLDEIGDLSTELQAKLLRVIEEGQFRPVGGSKSEQFRARLICATNRDLAKDVQDDRFRRDLYFRINGYEVRLPPLRGRENDVFILARHFLKMLSKSDACTLDRETLAILGTYPFPGNVRQLQTVIERAFRQSDGKHVRPMDLPIDMMKAAEAFIETPRDEPIKWPAELLEEKHGKALADIESSFNRQYLPRCFESTGRNVIAAARKAGMDPKTFRRKWEECGLGHLSSRMEPPEDE